MQHPSYYTPSSYSNARQLLSMNIQIDENRTGVINVYEGDDPQILALDFCNKYNVNQRIVPLLVENILLNVETAIKEQENMEKYVSRIAFHV